MKDVTERTDLLVDGIQRQRSGGGYDGIVLHTITDLGKEVARVGGPYAFCFSARLQPGIHRADISFTKSSGVTEEYAWTFEVTSHPIPTPTPLPDPPTIDSVGDLPSFLEAVYPSPGTTISLTQYQEPTDEFWEYLLPKDYRAQQAVCFAFRVDELHKLGSLPRNHQDWPDRIFVQVDSNLSGDWFYPTSYHGDSSSGRITAHCVQLRLSLGQHNATIYVHPFDDDLTIYSWSFSLAE